MHQWVHDSLTAVWGLDVIHFTLVSIGTSSTTSQRLRKSAEWSQMISSEYLTQVWMYFWPRPLWLMQLVTATLARRTTGHEALRRMFSLSQPTWQVLYPQFVGCYHHYSFLQPQKCWALIAPFKMCPPSQVFLLFLCPPLYPSVVFPLVCSSLDLLNKTRCSLLWHIGWSRVLVFSTTLTLEML